MSRPLISIVLPVYNEGENIAECLRRIDRALGGEAHEILVCYDFDEDATLPAIAAMSDRPASVRLVKNTFGRGAPNAIRAGFQAAQGDVVVTTMADLSDPPELIPRMAEKIRQGKDVVSGSRYMAGGSQSGGPKLKSTLSRTAGFLLHWIGGLKTLDPTNNFRAYSPRFLSTVEIESTRGFEIALELTVKAHLQGAQMDEIPSSWVDRSAGKSNFKLWKWMPNYLRWFVRAMLAPLLVLLALGVSLAIAWPRTQLAADPGAARLRLALLTCAVLAGLALTRFVRGRTTRWDVPQPLLWVLTPALVVPGVGTWVALGGASAVLGAGACFKSRR